MVRLECKAGHELGKKSKRSPQTGEADILVALLKETRAAKRLPQRLISKRLGFMPSVYGNIERGERVVDVIEFVELASALETDPLQLFGEFLIRREAARIKRGEQSG